MSLFNPNTSPSVLVREVDLSSVVPAVSTSTGAYVGAFNWGPVEQPVLVGNESGLVEVFGSPDQTVDSAPSSIDFLSATYFLKYAQSMYVTRVVGDAAANAKDSAAATNILVKNKDLFNGNLGGTAIAAKYPGQAGNSLSVKFIPASSDSTAWGTGVGGADSATRNIFDAVPSTSPYARDEGGEWDEVHVAVVDSDGFISGIKGTVLESFGFLSKARDAKTQSGENNYFVDVINNKSEWVWLDEDKVPFIVENAGNLAQNQADPTVKEFVNRALGGGLADHSNVTTGSYQLGWDTFSDADKVQIDLAIVGNHSGVASTTMTNYVTAIAEGPTRRDCVVVASPPRDFVVGVAPSTAVSNTVTWSNGLNASSYLIVDNNYLKIYDKYNDKYEFIPAASSTAGLMAATDRVAAPWYSPAGQRRGRYLGITSLSYTPDKSQRDTLYKANVNPIVNLPGQGVLLYGDKTKEARPSAFDRINVRRLFLAIERAIKLASANVLFEFNDEFTRAEFVNIVEPFLREIQGRRGITDFLVVCDESNNTPAVIDSNRFVASMFIKPARSINYVTLNFVAVRTGIDFQEVVGIV